MQDQVTQQASSNYLYSDSDQLTAIQHFEVTSFFPTQSDDFSTGLQYCNTQLLGCRLLQLNVLFTLSLASQSQSVEKHQPSKQGVCAKYQTYRIINKYTKKYLSLFYLEFDFVYFQAVRKAVSQLFLIRPLPQPTTVHFKVSGMHSYSFREM